MANLQLKFDASLPYQRDAIAAVVDLFDGQALADSSFRVSFESPALLLSEFGLGNRLTIDGETMLANLHRVQERNGIEMSRSFSEPDFTVEMETGTGKTYVYLRTAFELSKTYGLRKFVIVVPSVAIREGVLHSIQTMKEHFSALYSTPFDYYVYDSKKLGLLRSFAAANTMQIMVINIQAFQRDVRDGDRPGSANVIYRENDRLSGYRPIDFLRATRPIVIVDEPQKMEGKASTTAIAQLDPLCILRYSATYEGQHKVYRLGPIEALDQKLVKRIEVASVREEANVNDAYVRLIKVDPKRSSAQVEMNVGSGSKVVQKKVTVKSGDDLHYKSGGRQEYRNGFRVSEISFESGNEYIRFGNGQLVRLGRATGSLDDEVMRTQVYETVREHLDKEAQLRPKGIKVLSLFFIDKVANYRVYHDDGNSYSLGKIGLWFEAAYRELISDPRYAGLIPDPVEKIHDGYFARDKKGAYRDTSGTSKDDEAAYELIMRNKEQLLSLENPLRFIFSHSALREGWDNPNVFQICTLNESRSVTRKRQEIGRGLRLPVNQEGERIHDERINRLTVIANESYRDFAKALQTEYEEEANVRFGVVSPIAFSQLTIGLSEDAKPIGQAQSRQLWEQLIRNGYLDEEGRVLDTFDPTNPAFRLVIPEQFAGLEPSIIDTINGHLFENRVVNARRRQHVAVRKHVLLDPEFQSLWNTISQRTRYRVRFDTESLIEQAAAYIRQARQIEPLGIDVTTVGLSVTQAGVGIAETRRQYHLDGQQAPYIPDVLAYLQNETELTRGTLVQILVRSGRAEEIRINPQAFITMVSNEIGRAIRQVVLTGLQYEPLQGEMWEMRRLDDDQIITYLDNLYQVQNTTKSPYDYVEFDSRVELEFAKSLDEDERVRFFVKLPSWFKVDTPLGDYNPDWAIMFHDRDTLYLVQETKGTLDQEALRTEEWAKIKCGERHFDAIGVKYDYTDSWNTTVRRLSRSSAVPAR